MRSLSPQQWAALVAGDFITRRHDDATFKVVSTATVDRPDPVAQHMAGPIVTHTLRRVTPEIIESSDPLWWSMLEESEVA
jgi:hypothetical protein